MESKLLDKIRRINCLNAEMEALYHQVSLKLEMADNEMYVLYALYDGEGGCLLSDIYKKWGMRKQTVNSVIRKLEAEGVLYLVRYKGNAKKVLLTPKGTEYAHKTIGRLNKAEINTLRSWSEEEIDTQIRLMEKYVVSFAEQIEKL